MSNGMEDSPQDDEKFGLSTPTGNLANEQAGDRPAIEHSQKIDQADRRSGEKYKAMGWKGIDDNEPEEEDEEPQLTFGNKDPIPEDELDMTPMVDVTFLLLIFFMVTASFTLQKSIPQPPAASDAPSTNVVEEEEAQDYVEVIIDQNNSYYVTTRDSEEREAPSETEMRRMIKDAKDTYSPERIVITAHVDATHERLIAVCDAGQSSGLKIEVKTTDLEF
jgi:biopolymer transport protein ExbD